MQRNAQRAVPVCLALALASHCAQVLAQQSVPPVEEPPAAAPPQPSPSAPDAMQGAESAPAETPAPLPAPEPPTRPLLEAIELVPGESCLEHERLVKSVARWLERDAVDARIHVRVVGEDDTDIRFTIDRGNGETTERRIEEAPEDCRQLHAAVALSIALAIDATRPDAPAVELDLPDDESLVAAQPVESGYLRGAIALSLEAGSGVLTDVSAGGSLRLELGPVPWLDLRAGVLGTLVGDQSVGTARGGFDVDLLAARVDACPVTSPAQRFRVAACFGVALGRFRTVGTGFPTSFTESRPWSALMGALEAQLEFSPWLAVAAHVDLAVPLEGRSIRVLDASGDVVDDLEPPVAGMIVGVGPIFRAF